VRDVAAFIATEEARELLARNGIELSASLLFRLGQNGEEFDTVDARDMLLIPQGGRTILSDGRIMKQPRMRPFGSPSARFGAIDEEKFSRAMLDLNAAFFREVELVNRRPISTSELADPIRGLCSNASVAVALKIAKQQTYGG
jgi:hypothetical protein